MKNNVNRRRQTFSLFRTCTRPTVKTRVLYLENRSPTRRIISTVGWEWNTRARSAADRGGRTFWEPLECRRDGRAGENGPAAYVPRHLLVAPGLSDDDFPTKTGPKRRNERRRPSSTVFVKCEKKKNQTKTVGGHSLPSSSAVAGRTERRKKRLHTCPRARTPVACERSAREGDAGYNTVRINNIQTTNA